MEDATGRNESVGARLARLVQNILALLQARLDLARQEARGAVRDLVTGAVLLLIALVLAVLAVPLAVATAVLLLALVVPAWAAAGLVLLAILVGAGILALLARLRLRRPRVTLLRGLREDWQMIRTFLEGRHE